MPRHLTVENISKYSELEQVLLTKADEDTETLEFIRSPAIGYAHADTLSNLPKVSHLIFKDTPLRTGNIIQAVSKLPQIKELTISSANVAQHSDEETLEKNLSDLVSKLPHVTKIHVIDHKHGTSNKNTALQEQLEKLVAARPVGAGAGAGAGASGAAFFTERKEAKGKDEGASPGLTTPDL